MNNALVTIRLKNRQKIVIENVEIATDTDHAKHIIMLAVTEKAREVEWEDVKVAEYTVDGKMVFAFLRQADGMHELTPSK